jgi:hypothetical protein
MSIQSASGASRGSSVVGGAFNQILKEFYRPAVVDQLNSKTVLSRLLGRRNEGIEGKFMVAALNTGRNHGIGVAGELGRLPDPQSQQYQQSRWGLRYSYGRIKFTGPGASGTRSDRGSFIRMMDSEVQGLARDIQHFDNRVCFGDGSGRLCEINVAGGGGAGPYDVTNPGGVVSSALGTQYLEEGMRVGTVANDVSALIVGTQPGAWSNSNRAAFIGAVDKVNGTVTFEDGNGAAVTPPTAGGTMYLYTANEESADLPGNSWGRGLEQNGLAALISDADPVFQDGVTGNYPAGLGEVPTATNSVWKSSVIGNGGIAQAFAPSMFQQGMDLADQIADGSIDLWMTTHGIRRQYLNTLVGAKRYNNTMELDGGFKALHYDGRPIVVDKDSTRGRIYGLNLETMFLTYETDYDWIDQDGSVLHRLPNQDAFQAAMYRYWNMATEQRNRQVLIEDILDY